MKHLTDEDIARMIDGHIDKQEREDFLHHFSQCHECLALYTETLKFIGAEKQKPAPVKLPRFLGIAPRIAQAVGFLSPGKRWVPALAGLLIILSLLFLPLIFKKTTWDKSARWLTEYGDYAAGAGREDPRVKSALIVFERLRNVVDKSGNRLPRLVIPNTRDKANALALPDNTVIITPGILDYCYHVPGQFTGDIALALILAHELSHLAGKDFSSHEMVAAFQDDGDRKNPPSKDRVEEYKKMEIEADRKAVRYAVMAGYDVSRLFTAENNFLQHWAKQTGIDYDKDQVLHPAPEKRTQSIREELARLAHEAELFRAGVLFFTAGSYTDARASFQAFAKVFQAREVLPAREVYNNIGLCYLHQALTKIYHEYSDDYFRFRTAIVIDYATSADMGQMRGSGDYLADKDISDYFTEAEKCFKEAKRLDPLDRTCRYNLAATLIWQQEYAHALDICDDLLATDPRDVMALNNKALALYGAAPEKNRQKAIKLLEKALALKPDHYECLYNLAIITPESGSAQGEAQTLWEEYLHLPGLPRDSYYRFIYEKLTGKTPPEPRRTAGCPEIPGGINLGNKVSDIGRNWGTAPSIIYEAKIGSDQAPTVHLQVLMVDNLRLIVLDDRVAIIEQELGQPPEIGALLEKFGPPQHIIHHTQGNFYIYAHESGGFSMKEIAGRAHALTWF